MTGALQRAADAVEAYGAVLQRAAEAERVLMRCNTDTARKTCDEVDAERQEAEEWALDALRDIHVIA